MNKQRRVIFTYSYLDKDSSKNIRAKNKFFLDTGNCLGIGMIDNNCGTKGLSRDGKLYRSTTGLLSTCKSLILDNLTDGATEVEFIITTEPILDTFAAVYLAQKIIETGHFPVNYEVLVDYVEEVNSGRLLLDQKSLQSPAAIADAIGKNLKKQILNGPSAKEIAERGLKLVNYIMEQFNRLKAVNGCTIRDFYYPELFPANSEFQPEIELLKDDYARYLEDVNNPEICERGFMRLPAMGRSEGYLKEVEALFWNRPSSCLLPDQWARQDKDSPMGNGYVFTFVPHPSGKFSLPGGREIEVNGVFMAVNPNSGVCLAGLAETLENRELEKEQELLGDNVDSRRSRERVRTLNYTTINEDPWYDGHDHNFTIVDSPKVGSLLSVEEIKKLTIDYTKPIVTESCNYFIFPVSFRQEEYSQMVDLISGYCHAKTCHWEQPERMHYFLPYVKDYFFCGRPASDKLTHCTYFEFTEGSCIYQDIKKEIADQVQQYKLENTYLIVFRYGVAFLLLNMSKRENEKLLFEELVKLNRKLCQQWNKAYQILYEIFKGRLLQTNRRQGLVYCGVKIDASTFYESEREEMLYKMCNHMSWDEPFAKCCFVESLAERLFFNVSKHAVYGFGKAGGGLILVESEHSLKQHKEKLDELLESFKTTDFDIFLLALHQREILMKFSHELGEFDNFRKDNKISELRSSMLNFTTQSWLSQITSDEMGAELYRHWQDIFENKTIYEEVFGQLSAVDDYYRANFSKHFENLSTIFFPVIMLGTMCTMFGTNIQTMLHSSNRVWIGLTMTLTLLLGVWKYLCKTIISLWLKATNLTNRIGKGLSKFIGRFYNRRTCLKVGCGKKTSRGIEWR